jgi:hypothetical protein
MKVWGILLWVLISSHIRVGLNKRKIQSFVNSKETLKIMTTFV